MTPIAIRAFNGLRTDIAAERLAFSTKAGADLVQAENIVLDSTGKAQLRPGFTIERAGTAHSLWPRDTDEGYVLFVAAGVLRRAVRAADATLSYTILTSGLSNEPMAYCKPTELIYFTNGVNKGVIEGNAVRSWGLPHPLQPTVALTAGNMPPGDYQYVITEQRVDGQESGCGAAARVTVPAGGGLTFTFQPVGDAAVTHRQVYLTTTNSDQLFLALTVLASASSASYTGDTGELSAELLTQYLEAPPVGTCLAWHAGEVYVADGDAVYKSHPLSYELFDLEDHFLADGAVRILAPLEGEGVFVCTDRSMSWLGGTGPMNERTWTELATYGAIPGTLSYVDASLFLDGEQGTRKLPVWLSKKGPCVGLPGGQIRNLTIQRHPVALDGRGASYFNPLTKTLVAVATA